MNLLPHWVLTDTFPAIYDSESKTAIEQTARVYGKMQELIKEYNSFVDSVNQHITDFENAAKKDYEVFTTAIRQEFQDFIDVVELKLMSQDKEISDAIDYMKENLNNSIYKILVEIRENGELTQDVLNAFNDIVTRIADESNARTTGDSTLQQNINSEAAARSAGDAALQQNFNTLSERMNTFTNLPEGSTTGDAELQDARIDYTGKTWDNVGSHIRGISSQLYSDIADEDKNILNLISLIGNTTFDKKESLGYLIEDGTIAEHNTDYHCLYATFKCYEGLIFKYKGLGAYLAISYIFFDDENNIICTGQIDSTTTFTNVVTPANAKKVIFSSLANVDLNISFDVAIESYNENLLSILTEFLESDMFNKNALPCESVGTYNNSFVNIKGLITTDFAGATYKKYMVEPLNTYIVKGINWASTALYAIFDSDDNLIECYPNEPQTSTKYKEYKNVFIPEKGSYILVNDFSGIASNFTYSVEKVSSFTISNTLKIGFDGDSLCHGNENGYVGYPELLKEIYNYDVVNLAVGGGTIASGTTTSSGTNRHWICESVKNLPSNCDVIIVEGGVNDRGNNVPLGTFNEDLTSADLTESKDTTTFYGALEDIAQTLITQFRGRKVFFLRSHKAGATDNSLKTYMNAIEDVCKKYSIPMIDIYGSVPFDTLFAEIANNYTVDGFHPNTEGYKKYYIPAIISAIK